MKRIISYRVHSERLKKVGKFLSLEFKISVTLSHLGIEQRCLTAYVHFSTKQSKFNNENVQKSSHFSSKVSGNSILNLKVSFNISTSYKESGIVTNVTTCLRRIWQIVVQWVSCFLFRATTPFFEKVVGHSHVGVPEEHEENFGTDPKRISLPTFSQNTVTCCRRSEIRSQIALWYEKWQNRKLFHRLLKVQMSLLKCLKGIKPLKNLPWLSEILM